MNDLISRQAAIDAIRAIPAAEQDMGRWKKVRIKALNGGTFEAYRCSECGSVYYWNMDYCGNCGAKMETAIIEGLKNIMEGVESHEDV